MPNGFWVQHDFTMGAYWTALRGCWGIFADFIMFLQGGAP